MRTFNQISQKLLLSGFWDFAKEVKQRKDGRHGRK